MQVKGLWKCRQAYLWYRLTGVGPPLVAFHFAPSRAQDVAELLFGDYSGIILRDSHIGYEKLECEVACCWAHVRRRILETYENGYSKAEELLVLLRALYKIEHEPKAQAEKKGTETALFQARKNARRESGKIVVAFFERCRILQESERLFSPVIKAGNYALNIEDELKKFPNNPKLNIDDNPNAISFRQWLEEVLPRLTTTSANQIDSLLPHFWNQAKEQ